MPRLAHIANLWSLLGHPTPAREWTLEKKIKSIAAAGFDGLATRLTPAHRHLAEASGLRHLLGFISSDEPAEFSTLIREQKEAGAVHINVQMDNHDTPPAVATQHWLGLVRAAEKIGGVVVSLELHRDCCTETPEKTYEIAERYHRATGELIKLTFDLSHFACVKQLHPGDYVSRLLDHPDLVAHCEQMHFRPFNGNHCQVPVTYRGALTPEVKDYLVFVAASLRLWKKAPSNRDRTLFACPEMGPYGLGTGRSGYNLTGLPPAWTDAIALRPEIAAAWVAA